MSNESLPFKREWFMALKDAIKILESRAYLHKFEDVELVRPKHKSVFLCTNGGSNGPLNLKNLDWIIEKGELYFNWYIGSYFSLNLRRGSFEQEVTFDPTKQDPWLFVGEIDQTFK